MEIIDESDYLKVRNLIKKSKGPIIIKAKNDSFNRKILEYGKFDILLSVEAGEKKENLRQLNSGLNLFMAKLAKKNKVSIGIDLRDIRNLNENEKFIRLAKIIQNIKLCRKADASIRVLNYKNKRDAFSLLLTLGASTKQAKKAVE